MGENVIVVGGGLTGCEIAYDLFLNGKKPTIIEMKNDLIAVKAECLANSSYLRDFFELNKVPVYLKTKLKEITDDGLIATDKRGKEILIKGDKVIMSVGYVPSPIVEGNKKAYFVGNCQEVGNLRTVIWSGWDVAMKL